MLPSLEDMARILNYQEDINFDNLKWKVLARCIEPMSRDNSNCYYHPDNYINVLFQYHPHLTQIIALPIYPVIQYQYRCKYSVIYIGTIN